MTKKKVVTAVRPDFFVNVPVLAKTTGEKNATEEEVTLYAMSKTAGWAVFRKMAEQAIVDLNNVNKAAIAQGLPLVEIGQNAVVVNLAQEAIERLLNRVTDASEACAKTE